MKLPKGRPILWISIGGGLVVGLATFLAALAGILGYLRLDIRGGDDVLTVNIEGEDSGVLEFSARIPEQAQDYASSQTVPSRAADETAVVVRFRAALDFAGNVPEQADLHFVVPEYASTRMPVTAILDTGDQLSQETVLLLAPSPIRVWPMTGVEGHDAVLLLGEEDTEEIPLSRWFGDGPMFVEAEAFELGEWLNGNVKAWLIFDLSAFYYGSADDLRIVPTSQK